MITKYSFVIEFVYIAIDITGYWEGTWYCYWKVTVGWEYAFPSVLEEYFVNLSFHFICFGAVFESFDVLSYFSLISTLQYQI